MLANFVPTFSPPPWQAWLVPLAGVISAGLALVMARALARRQGSPGLKEAPAAGTASSGRRVERRKSPRRGGPPVKVLLSDVEAKSTPVIAWVQNRSLGGLCLAVPQEYAVGEILSVRAAAAPASIPWVQIDVRYCYLSEESWLIGCKFVSEVPWNVMLLFD